MDLEMDETALLFPDFDLKLQLDVELLLDFFFHQFYQPHNVFAGAALLRDEKVGVLFAYDCPAYLQTL